MLKKESRLIIVLISFFSLLAGSVTALDPFASMIKFLSPVVTFLSRLDLTKIGSDPFTTNFVLVAMAVLTFIVTYHELSTRDRTRGMTQGSRISISIILSLFIFGIPKALLALFGSTVIMLVTILIIGGIVYIAYSIGRWVWSSTSHPAWQRIITGLFLIFLAWLAGLLFENPIQLWQSGMEFLSFLLALAYVIGFILLISGIVMGLSRHGQGGHGGGGHGGGGGGGGGGLPVEPFPNLDELDRAGREGAANVDQEGRFGQIEDQLNNAQQQLDQHEAQIDELERQAAERGEQIAGNQAQILEQLQRHGEEFARMREELQRLEREYRQQLEQFRNEMQRQINEMATRDQEGARRLLEEARAEYERRRQAYEQQLQALRQQVAELEQRMQRVSNQFMDYVRSQQESDQALATLLQEKMKTETRTSDVLNQLTQTIDNWAKAAEGAKKSGVPGAEETEDIEKTERKVVKGRRRGEKQEYKINIKLLRQLRKALDEDKVELELSRELIECLNPENIAHDNKEYRQHVQAITKSLLGEYKKSIKYHHLMKNLYDKGKKAFERDRKTPYTLKDLQDAANRSLEKQKKMVKRAA
ncbi:hypothetical protein HYS47_04025 [Candidatus Woesearchaeota archaeon]|nr:hypothetical protein [Candidatus Woesearchaeota archaeon]